MELFDNNTYFHCVVLGCANLFTSMILWSCINLGWAEQQHCPYKAVLFGFDDMSLGQAEQNCTYTQCTLGHLFVLHFVTSWCLSGLIWGLLEFLQKLWKERETEHGFYRVAPATKNIGQWKNMLRIKF